VSGDVTAPLHQVLHPEVTRFSNGVPTEVTCACSCPEAPTLTGTGSSLEECRDDILTKFAVHAGVQFYGRHALNADRIEP
jgi:hypothetical protein